MSEPFLSVRWNACVHRLDLGLYSHPKEVGEGGGGSNESEPMLTPRKKSPLREKKKISEEDQTHDTASNRTASPTHYQRAIRPCFGNEFSVLQGLTPLEMTLSLEGPGHHEMALCLLHHGASPGRLLPASVPGTHGSLTNTSCDPSQNNGFKQSGTDPLLVCTDSRGTDTDEFHKLRFLEALLAATFVTPGNLWRLVLLGLLTPESLEVVQAALEGRESDCGRGSSDEAAAAEQDQAYNGQFDYCDA